MDAQLHKACTHTNSRLHNRYLATENIQHCRSTLLRQHRNLLRRLRLTRHIHSNHNRRYNHTLRQPSAGCSCSVVRRKPHTSHTHSNHRLHHRHDNQLRISIQTRTPVRHKKNQPPNPTANNRSVAQIWLDNLHPIRFNPAFAGGNTLIYLWTAQDTPHHIYNIKLLAKAHSVYASSVFWSVYGHMARRSLNI